MFKQTEGVIHKTTCIWVMMWEKESISDVQCPQENPNLSGPPFQCETRQWMDDGWIRVLRPIQQYFSHFQMMEG